MQLLFVKYRYNTCLLAFEDYVRYLGYDYIMSPCGQRKVSEVVGAPEIAHILRGRSAQVLSSLKGLSPRQSPRYIEPGNDGVPPVPRVAGGFEEPRPSRP